MERLNAMRSFAFHVHRVRAKIQPPTSGGASWSNWIGSNTVAKITTSYTVVDSNHQVFN